MPPDHHEDAAPTLGGTLRRFYFECPSARRAWIQVAITMGIVLALDAVDPFGWVTLSGKHSTTVANRIFGGAYPDDAYQEITVVLAGDPLLENKRWPASYAFHESILGRILEQQPRAIFVDIWFPDDEREDSSVTRLTRLLDRARTEGVPIFFAANSTAADGQIRPDLLRTNGASGGGEVRAKPALAIKVTDPDDGVHRHYPLFYAERSGSPDARSRAEAPTAPLLLYDAWLAGIDWEESPGRDTARSRSRGTTLGCGVAGSATRCRSPGARRRTTRTTS